MAWVLRQHLIEFCLGGCEFILPPPTDPAQVRNLSFVRGRGGESIDPHFGPLRLPSAKVAVREGRDDLVRRTARLHRRAQLLFSNPDESATELRASFVVEKLQFKSVADLPPANAHLRWTRLAPDDDPVLSDV